MVLQGQDAWRKHPLLSGMARKPFPMLGTAVGIFAIYLVVDATFSYATGSLKIEFQFLFPSNECPFFAPISVNETYAHPF